MGIEDWGALAEIVGAVAVFITLVYLAMQIRLSERTARAQLNQSFSHDINAVNFMIANDPVWFGIFRRASESLEILTPDERGRYSFLELAVCRTMESLYLHHLKGLVDEDVWQSQRLTLISLASSPGWREWWQDNPFPFTPAFRAIVDAAVREAVASGTSDRTVVLYGESAQR